MTAQRAAGIKIYLSTDDAAKSFERFKQNVSKGVADGAKASRDMLANLNKNFGAKLGAGLAGIAAAGVAASVAAVKESVSAYAELEQQIRAVKSIAGETFAKDQGLEQSIELSKRYGLDAASQAKALYSTISAGIADAGEAAKVLEVANRTAIGGLTSVEVAVDGLTTIINAYGLSADQASRASDALFTAAAIGKTDLEGLSREVGKVASISAQAGVTIEEMAAAIGAITQQGVNTAEATTQLRSLLTAFVAPTKEAQQLAKALKLDLSVNALRSKGLLGAVQELYRASGGNQKALFDLIGRIEGFSGAVNLASGNFSKFKNALDQSVSSAGATDRAYNELSGSLENQVKRLYANIDASKILAGQYLATGAVAHQFERALNGVSGESSAVSAAIKGADQALGGFLATMIDASVRGKGAFASLANVIEVALTGDVSGQDRKTTTQKILSRVEEKKEIARKREEIRQLIEQRERDQSTITMDAEIVVTENPVAAMQRAQEIADATVAAKKQERERLRQEEDARYRDYMAEGQRMADAQEYWAQQAVQANRDMNEAIAKRNHDFAQAQRDARQAEIKEASAGTEQLKEIAASTLSGVFQSVASDIAQGELTVGKFFSTLLGAVGDALVGLGSAAIAAGVLGTAAPLLFPWMVGPVAVGAGLAAITVGTALKAGAIASAGSAAGANSSQTRRPAPTDFRRSAPQVLGGDSVSGNTYVIQLNGPIGGSPRAIATDLQRMLDRGGLALGGSRA